MSLAVYRRVLARRGVPAVILIGLFARIPIAAAPVVLTLHVVLDLGRGYGLAGLLGAAFAVGAAVGAPLVGRTVDRVGLRPVVAVTTVASTAFWTVAPHLEYAVLLPAALLAGVLSLPVFSVTRQALAAMLAPEQRRPGFSLDSMAVEVSFAVGPAAGIALYTATTATTTLAAVAGLVLVAGAALYALDPPVRDAELTRELARTLADGERAARPRLRSWLSRPVVALLLVTSAATVTVSGTDTALSAVMTSWDAVPHLGLVFAVWCLASLAGGFVFGALQHRPSPLVVLLLLAGTALPVSLAGSWPVLALLVVPTGLFCAPLMAGTAEALTHATPATVRGLALGVHASALTLGDAFGAPLTGVAVDRFGAQWGFAAVGAAGLVLAGLAVLVGGWRAPEVADAAASDLPAPRGERAGQADVLSR
ncbi:MFS transporter [Quadrisphaera oryzae]|uniref:MFS transporter n=1 Tax=Quadrisphaera TaxID=317661 RepID=UPI001648A01F|nr:MFS transporter [Quadrisphaera sp. RL12-1S]MBC3763358.1 MFS transporter [Quadrisphaera sp. RL12-1S]